MANIQVQTERQEEDFKNVKFELFDNGSLRILTYEGATVKRYTAYISVTNIEEYNKHVIEYQ